MTGRATFWQVIVGLLMAPAVAQETQPALPSERPRELQQAHTIITDTRASPEVRRIGAENLLELNSPAAIDLAIEMLSGNGDPLPRVAICEAVATVAARRPELLDGRMVAPLLNLLRSADAQVRSVAARALSCFPDGSVAEQLGGLAADEQAPVAQRLAAVDALAPNVDQRQVVRQLVLLLDLPSPEVRSRVLSALRPASGVDYGSDVEGWKRWWQDKAALDDSQWLHDRVRLLRQQNRESQDGLARLQADTRQQLELLSRRLGDQLAQVYRLTPPGQREELVIRWLNDPLADCRGAAVSQVAADLSDGNRPSETVRAALRERLADESSDLRRRVLDVIAALTDPGDVQAVLARLGQESDPVVREAILRTLGRLHDPAAIGPLAAVLASANATEGCLVEAADSLRLLGARGEVDPVLIAVAIAPLKERFNATGTEVVRLRAALLRAMASIGAPEFAGEFLANLDTDQPDLLLPALEGIKTIGETSRTDRVLALTASNDERVRKRAIEALGRDPTHLEALASRLNPASETSEAVRQAAWDRFRAILSDQSPQMRLHWAARLHDLPEREEQYLIELAADLAGDLPQPPELNVVRRRLAETLDDQQRYAEAFPLWRELWLSYAEVEDAAAAEVGLSYLQELLRVERYELAGGLVSSLLVGADETRRGELQAVLLSHLTTVLESEDRDQIEPYLAVLDALSAGTFGPEFRRAIRDARSRLPSPTTRDASGPAEG